MWALADEERLTREARTALEDPDNAVIASAASVWELEVKRASGRLTIDVDLVEGIHAVGFTTLAIAPEHASAAARLPLHHRDPFDRMLIAQAQLEGLTIVTRDPQLAKYSVALLSA